MSTHRRHNNDTSSRKVEPELIRHETVTPPQRKLKPSSSAGKPSHSTRPKSESSITTTAISTLSKPDPTTLPKTVRNMPPELRLAIRRKQNNDCSKRGRERRKAQDEKLRECAKKNEIEIQRLEETVLGLESQLDQLRKTKSKGRRRNEHPKGQGEFFENLSFFGDPF